MKRTMTTLGRILTGAALSSPYGATVYAATREAKARQIEA